MLKLNKNINNDEDPKGEMYQRLQPYNRKPETFLLFRGDIVLELVLPDVVKLQPELISSDRKKSYNG